MLPRRHRPSTRATAPPQGVRERPAPSGASDGDALRAGGALHARRGGGPARTRGDGGEGSRTTPTPKTSRTGRPDTSPRRKRPWRRWWTRRCARAEEARAGRPGDGQAVHVDALRAKRPRLAVLAGDCDPVIPPRHPPPPPPPPAGSFGVSATDRTRRETEEAATTREHLRARTTGTDARTTTSRLRRRRRETSASDPDATLRSMLSDGGEHFSHYDLLCGRRAPELVFPVVAEFIEREGFFEGIRRRRDRAASRGSRSRE